MVRHLGVTDRAEIDGVVEPQPLDAVLRHHHAHVDVALAAPIEFVPLEAKTVSPRRSLHCGDPLRHHLAPDAVACDHRDPIILCHGESSMPPRVPAAAQILKSQGGLSNAKPTASLRTGEFSKMSRCST